MYLAIARHRNRTGGSHMARRHSSPEDFQLLGMDSDPTPGDPAVIQDIAKRYREIGDAAERAFDLMKKDGGLSRGKGAAMDKLTEKIGDDLPEKLKTTMTSYHDAAQAYSEYIPRLQEAQGTFDQAVDRARTAAPQANLTPPQLSAQPTDEERAQARSAQDSIAAGQAEMGAARGLAEQAKAMRESAQRRCAEVLDRAASEAIPERNIFQKIADFFKDFPFVQIILALLVAVVSVFFPLVGVLLGGALFIFNQVVASQTGGIKAGDFVTGLLGIIPGGSLLKLGGRALEAAAPALVAAVKNFPLLKQATGSIGRIGESLTNTKVIGGFIRSPVGKAAGDITKDFAVNSGIEAASKAANHDQLTAAGILAGAAAGAVAKTAFKGVVGGIGKARGNTPVEEGQPGRFGDTTEPALGDSLGKKFSDQAGATLEEGATLGTKIGVGVAQGGDPNEVAAGEIANSAAKIGVGAIGKAGFGRSVDGLTDKIPFKGSPRPDVTPPAPHPATPPSPPETRPTTPAPAPDTRPDTPAPAPDTRPTTPAPAPAPPAAAPAPAPAPVPATAPASAPAAAPAPAPGPATAPQPAPAPAPTPAPASAPAPAPATAPVDAGPAGPASPAASDGPPPGGGQGG